MFSRLCLVCIYCVIICNAKSPAAPEQKTDLLSSSQVNSYDVRIAQQDTRFAEFEKYISGLETKIEQQNVRFAEQDAPLERQKVRFAELEALLERQNTKFSDQYAVIEHQNTNMADLKSLISEQNVQLCKLKSELESLQKPEMNVTSTQSSKIGNDTGVIFTRWGKKDCPENISTKIYNGITGGAHFTVPGGAVNYLCMPYDPIWNQDKYFSGGSFQYVYGAEYETHPQSGSRNKIYQYEVPCAVCRATPYTTTMMIPGRNKCYPGWEEAYHGELMSGYGGHTAASEYICLDDDPTKIGQSSNLNGKLLYSVKSKCGALPCPPYADNGLLTCAVCLK